LITASPAHAAACAAIHAASFPQEEAWGEAAFAELLASPGVRGLIDEAGGLVLMRQAADEAEILTLATMDHARRQGIGRRVLMGGLAWAESQGAVRVFLEVSESNAPARTLYAAAGFTVCGRRRRYYTDGSDALVLQTTAGG
jgi:ribosomal-protein-alanine N-acetyltransferase